MFDTYKIFNILGHSLKCYEFSDETKLGEGVECPSEANACLKAVAGKATAFTLKFNMSLIHFINEAQ